MIVTNWNFVNIMYLANGQTKDSRFSLFTHRTKGILDYIHSVV
jgi:hypothetical protein